MNMLRRFSQRATERIKSSSRLHDPGAGTERIVPFLGDGLNQSPAGSLPVVVIQQRPGKTTATAGSGSGRPGIERFPVIRFMARLTGKSLRHAALPAPVPAAIIPMKSLSRILLFLFLLTGLPSGAAETSRPNVVVIMCDDLGYGDIGGFGNSQAAAYTPRIHRMAAEGMKLTNFLVPVPYCAPSRASFLTGRYPYRNGVVYNPTPDQDINDYGLDPSEITIAELLKKAGYATACIGKWHLGHKPGLLPTDQGFDYYLGILYSNDMRPVQLVENEQVVEYPVIQGNLTRKYTQAAIRFIRTSVESGTPFFLYLPHAMPHKPLAASEEFFTPDTPDNLYEDVIRELDWSVGAILDELKALDVDRNTLVIFTSDNGPWYGGNTGGLRGMKASTWEGGIRVPFIARWPGRIPEGRVNPALASSMDLFPTFLDLAGVTAPDDRPIDGRDLWPLLISEAAPSPHEFLISMHRDHLMTVHSGPWKLHVKAPAPYHPPQNLESWVDPRGPDGLTLIAPWEQSNPGHYPGTTTGDAPRDLMLFDTVSDPGETTDVSDHHPSVVERLQGYTQSVLADIPDMPPPTGSGKVKHIRGGRLDFWNIPGNGQDAEAERSTPQ